MTQLCVLCVIFVFLCVTFFISQSYIEVAQRTMEGKNQIVVRTLHATSLLFIIFIWNKLFIGIEMYTLY